MKMLILGLAVLFVLMATVPIMDSAFAQYTDPMPDSEGERGEHEGKYCPFKNKSASVNLLPNI